MNNFQIFIFLIKTIIVFLILKILKILIIMFNYLNTSRPIIPIKQKDLYNFEHRWKLRDWIDIDKLNWVTLSGNPNAMYLLEENPDKIDWKWLSLNSSAIHLLEKNPEKINWILLSSNKTAIPLLHSQTTFKPDMHLLEKNKDKIDWTCMCRNPAIFELDYEFFFNRMNIIRKELIEKTWHPNRFKEWCLDIDEVKELC